MRNKGLKFYYGQQWQAASKTNKNIPRPVFNICKLDINNKQSNIVSVPVALKFITNNSTQDTTTMTRFTKYLLKEMKHEKYRDKATFDALVKGTAIQHMYYNDKKYGTFGDFVGGVSEEIIDMQNVAIANPFCKDIQAQKYIVIRKKQPVGALKKMCTNKENQKFITPESWVEENTDKTEVQDSDLVYSYLKYYRKNGEVYFSLSTKYVEIYKDKALNPNLHKVVKVKGETENDDQWVELPDNELTPNDEETYSGVKFYRYPVNILSLNESDDSIFGVSELKDAIATQKYINQLWGMQLLNVMNTAWDKYVVLPNALRGQIISDQSGQVLTDYSGTGNGIKRLGGMNAMANSVTQMAADAFNLFRTVNQITDLYSGQTDTGDLAASAISQLNNQADKPIDVLRKKLWAFEEEIGKTLDLFIKLYYKKVKYSYELTNAEKITMGDEANPYQEEEIDATQFANTEFHVVCEAIQGTKNSELIQENMMQSLFVNGAWNNMDSHNREMYIRMSPLAEPIKDELLALYKKQQVDEIAQRDNVIAQLQQQNQELANTLQRAKAGIEYQGNVISSLQKSYKDERKSHMDDVTIRDNAVKEILNNKPDDVG